MCRLICKGRTVFFSRPLPSGAVHPFAGQAAFSVSGHGRRKRRITLSWHNGSAWKKLEARQRQLAEEYRAAGMTEAQIAEMAAFDLEVLRSDRRFYRHTQSLCPGGQGPEEAPEPGYDGSEPPLTDRLD